MDFKTCKIVNSTYYDVDDVVSLLVAFKTFYSELGTFDDQRVSEVHVRLMNLDRAKVDVFLENGLQEDGKFAYRSRMVVGIVRRTQLTSSTMEAIACLSSDNAVLPSELVTELAFQYGKLFLTNVTKFGSRHWGEGFNTQLRLEVRGHLDKFPMQVRIHNRASSDAKIEAAKARLNEQIAKRQNTIKWGKYKISQLERSFADMTEKVKNAEARLLRDVEKLNAILVKEENQNGN